MQEIGTVVKRTKSFYYVDTGKREPYLCRIRGSLFFENSHKNKIAVGDKVEINRSNLEKTGWIKDILPRQTKLSRRNDFGDSEQVLVSNADSLLIVASLKSPPFRRGLVDRFLVAGSCGGLDPILILSKADLVNSKEINPIFELYSSLGYKVLTTSVFESRGLESLRNLITNRISVLSGHSGVGKSSLIGALFPEWEIKIGQISNKTGKGKHTTIMAEMFRLPKGGFIVDTPGIRTLEPIVNKQELDLHFAEFSPFLGQCKFKGCTHRHEPMCKIKEVVITKEITEQRYKSYCNIFDSL